MLCGNDLSFGPGAQCRSLDFTLFFSNIFLSFVPALIFGILAVSRLWRLVHKKNKLLPVSEIPWAGWAILVSRVTTSLLLFAASIATPILWSKDQYLPTDWSARAAYVTDILAATALIAVVTLEFFRCARSSQPPALYLLVTTLLVASRVRTAYLVGSTTTSRCLVVSLAARVALCLALQFSTRTSLKNGAHLPPADTAGLISRYSAAWLLPLLLRGWRKPLVMDDLGEIDQSLHSTATWNAFRVAWEKQRQRLADGQTKQPLIWACYNAFTGLLLAPILPAFIYSVVSMARPLLVLHAVNFVQSHTSSGDSEPIANGWGLVGGTFLTYAVFAVALVLSKVAVQRSALVLRGAFLEGIYRKTLVITTEMANQLGAAKASNLMSVDVDNIQRTIFAIHQSWTAIVQTGLGLYIIWTQIKWSFLASVIGALIFFASLQPLTRKIAGSRKGWAEATDGRVQFMSSVLRHVKAVKLSAYERFVIGKAEGLREKELAGYIKFVIQALKVSIATNWLGNFLALVTVITFTVVSLYSDQGGDAVTTAKIFTVITTITLISDPLLMLGQQVGNIIQAWASFKRIEEFLLCAEKQEINVESAITVDVKVKDLSIDLTEATFGITGETPLELLKGINVKVQGECLWMITGRVGSGKSLMLQALLGELDVFGGSASVNMGRVGFCCQDPWLRTGGTIRDNILFEQPYDRAWYKEVIKSMALDIDFNTISEGDSTLVGSLSGGQRQRVALARAVYGRYPALVLDDVFSALDADTEAHVFKALFGEQGLLRGKMVVVATNQVYRLSSASLVTVMDCNSISQQGSYEELIQEDGILRSLVGEAGATKLANERGPSKVLAEQVVDNDAASEARNEVQAGQEKVTQGTVKWSTYLVYLRSMSYQHAVVWVSLVVVTAAILTSMDVYLQGWTTNLPGSPNSRYGAFLGGYAGMQIGYLICFAWAIIHCFSYTHVRASRQLHSWQIRGLLGTSLSFFDSRPIGEMVNRFNSDLFSVDFELPNAAVNAMSVGAQIVGAAILMIVAGPYMAAVLAGCGGAMIVLQRFYVRAARELRRLDLVSRSPIYTLFSETIDLDGLRTIRAMQKQTVCRELNTRLATASQHPVWLITVVQVWLELALNFCVLFVNTLLVVIAVTTRNSISPGILAVALSQGASLNNYLSQFIIEWTKVEMCITSVERIQEYVELPPQETNASAIQNYAMKKDWPSRGSVHFSNVTARYRPDLPPALSDVSFVAKAGQRVGICGRSGSGKSTLLGVLWRLIDLDEGDIFVDDVDIEDVPLEVYRSALSIIPQDPMLLEMTLRENLDPEGQKTDAEIWEALDRSQLKAHVESLPGKLDEVITGNGGSFSRGQRQLLALARAMLRQRRILALDEATSSIDVNTDAAIQETIRDCFNDCTVLTIAHRISTVIDYDLIVVMEAGRVVEIGKPEVLLRRENGHFRRLAKENGAIDDMEITSA